ncbi:response regulator [uncultured Alteromonas sp.]|jgi:CheY-like chemotaxis protein|uniref:response regulator n=1 Tax=uncultured Alteromonas sp. TaxID=179113 RepID=UPI0025D3EC4B|nr:response regulator [uncultured Alteromonas sp.]
MPPNESLKKIIMRHEYIFVVDDDEDDRELISDALMENHIKQNQIHLAEDGYDLISQLQDSNSLPRFILLDLNMPRMGGKEVLESIKKENRYRHIPIIIFSTSDADADIEECYQLGCSAYLSKPSDYQSLQDLMQATIQFWNNTSTKLLSWRERT